MFVSFCSVETCLAEWPVAPFARAQHPEDDDHGVVAAPASRVAPLAGVRVVEGVAAADAAVLGPGGLELAPRAGVRADRQEPARPRVQRQKRQLPDEAAEPRRAGRAVLVLQVPRPGAAVGPVLDAADVDGEPRLVVEDSRGGRLRAQVRERVVVERVLRALDHLIVIGSVLDTDAVGVERVTEVPARVVAEHFAAPADEKIHSPEPTRSSKVVSITDAVSARPQVHTGAEAGQSAARVSRGSQRERGRDRDVAEARVLLRQS